MPFRYSSRDQDPECRDCPHEDVDKNAHCRFTQNSSNLRTSQRSFTKGMNTQTRVDSFSGKLPSNKGERATDSWISTCNDTEKALGYYAEQKNSNTEEYIPRDSTHRKVSKGKSSKRNHSVPRARRKSGQWRYSPEAKPFQHECHELALTSFHNTGWKHQPQDRQTFTDQEEEERRGILGPRPGSAE